MCLQRRDSTRRQDKSRRRHAGSQRDARDRLTARSIDCRSRPRTPPTTDAQLASGTCRPQLRQIEANAARGNAIRLLRDLLPLNAQRRRRIGEVKPLGGAVHPADVDLFHRERELRRLAGRRQPVRLPEHAHGPRSRRMTSLVERAVANRVERVCGASPAGAYSSRSESAIVRAARAGMPTRARAARRSSAASSSRLTSPESMSAVVADVGRRRARSLRAMASLPASAGDHERRVERPAEQRRVAPRVPRGDDERRIAAAEAARSGAAGRASSARTPARIRSARAVVELQSVSRRSRRVIDGVQRRQKVVRHSGVVARVSTAPRCEPKRRQRARVPARPSVPEHQPRTSSAHASPSTDADARRSAPA